MSADEQEKVYFFVIDGKLEKKKCFLGNKDRFLLFSPAITCKKRKEKGV
jgi:hypothetical protein